jgi:hypothetical protein
VTLWSFTCTFAEGSPGDLILIKFDDEQKREIVAWHVTGTVYVKVCVQSGVTVWFLPVLAGVDFDLYQI